MNLSVSEIISILKNDIQDISNNVEDDLHGAVTETPGTTLGEDSMVPQPAVRANRASKTTALASA